MDLPTPGFQGGRKLRENRAVLASFLEKPSAKILFGGPDTAEIFGTVKDRLRRAGKPIPINDVWIAAHALENGAQLITFDAHFKHVAGLNLWGQASVPAHPRRQT